jgi:hypothetical protein
MQCLKECLVCHAAAVMVAAAPWTATNGKRNTSLPLRVLVAACLLPCLLFSGKVLCNQCL